MKTTTVRLEGGDVVHVALEVPHLRYHGDRFVVGVVVGYDDIAETDLVIVECELAGEGDDGVFIPVNDYRELALSHAVIDKIVSIVAAARNGTLETG